MRTKSKRQLWLTIFVFLGVFQPPVLPVSFIYVFGVLSVILFLKEHFNIKRAENNVFKKSKMQVVVVTFSIVAIYWFLISIIDTLLISQYDLLQNRMRCFNQLVVLTAIQFISIAYILEYAKRHKIGKDGLMNILITVGIVQGIFTVAAYLFPFVRKACLYFSDDIYQNSYVFERRGYGFSMTLLDTYGYGVGLIAGCSIINLRQSKSKLKNLLCFALCLFSAFVNSRSGLIIIAIAVICAIFKSKNKKSFLLKIIPSMAVLTVLFFWGVPLIFNILSESGSTTVRWVTEGVENLYSILRYGSISDLKNASFLSDLTSIPVNKFELIFGSGHSVYGIRDIIGFHSDVGYINTIWTYGIIGAIAINLTFLYLLISTFTLCKTPNEKCLIAFITISYYVIQLKAIVIGYNPGVYLTYFIVFLLAYFNRRQERKRQKEVLVNTNARKFLQY